MIFYEEWISKKVTFYLNLSADLMAFLSISLRTCGPALALRSSSSDMLTICFLKIFFKKQNIKKKQQKKKNFETKRIKREAIGILELGVT